MLNKRELGLVLEVLQLMILSANSSDKLDVYNLSNNNWLSRSCEAAASSDAYHWSE